MDLRQLNAFVAVVREGGFSQASKVLAVTQSTVSKSVKQLEDEVELVLLDRGRQPSRPTIAGELVYNAAVKLLIGRSELATQLDELRGVRRGRLSLGVPPIGSSTLFAPLLATYLKRYPGIEVSLSEHGSERLQSLLAQGDIELAAMLLPVAHEFEWVSVRIEPLVAILSRSHPLAQNATIDLAALRDIPFILFEAGFGLNRIILGACAQLGFAPTVAARSAQVEFVAELAAAGLGVAFLPRMIAAGARENVVQILIKNPSIDWHIAMTWRRGAVLSHAAEAWMELVREVYGGAPVATDRRNPKLAQ